jgi:IS5 family transposase
MRKKSKKQLPLMITSIDHPHAAELEGISKILEANPIINEWVLQDLTKGSVSAETGAEGMTAEQVLRSAIIKQMEGYSYEELAFHLLDSVCYRGFCRIGFVDKGFQKSALCGNIKAITTETWEAINRILVAHGLNEGIEKGKQTRIDCTVVSSNIHEPTDSSLLWDSVRVLTRMLIMIKESISDINIPFADHRRRAKRRMLGVMNARNEKDRKLQYQDLLNMAHKTVGYASHAASMLESRPYMAEELKHMVLLAEKVIDQTTRRVVKGESVPASEKVVSIFEPHTDVIVKDRRETHYGHKICISGGPSNLITDCVILKGNPADTALTDKMLDRHQEIYEL